MYQHDARLLRFGVFVFFSKNKKKILFVILFICGVFDLSTNYVLKLLLNDLYSYTLAPVSTMPICIIYVYV